MISSTDVMTLRKETGIGVAECKAALEQSGGDIAKAIDFLRSQGKKVEELRAGKEASAGAVFSYIHPGNLVGVMIEIACETDFVARTDDFLGLCKDLAMQVAAMSPRYVSKEDIPEDVLSREKSVLTEQARNEGKPENIIAKMIEGRLRKFYEQECLLEQPFIKDDKSKVKILVEGVMGRAKEKVVVKRFCRYEVGE